MKKILELCLRWRLLVFVGVALVVVMGVRSALRLPIDAVPDVTNVQVQVLTNVPALGPVDVERTVTFPIESAMSGIPDVEEIRSISRFGLSAVTIVFEEGTDLLRARQLVSERLVQAREELPAGVQPEMGPLSTGLGEVLQFEVRRTPTRATRRWNSARSWTGSLRWSSAACPAWSRSTASAASSRPMRSR